MGPFGRLMSVTPADPAFRDTLTRNVRAGGIRGVDPAGEVGELVGTGESYAAWRVQEGLLRVALRHPRDMPKSIADEFAAMRLVPADLGSHGIAYDADPDNPLGHAYVVTTFVPGRVLAPQEWTPPRIHRHVEQLARLHTVHPPAGPSSPVSAEARAGLAWWRGRRPDVVESVEHLIEPWLAYLHARDDAWDGAVRAGLIHGDLVTTNIVTDDAGVPRYVDWEWGGPGDPSKDLAMVGGTVHGGRWYVPLDDAGTADIVAHYVTARAALGAPVDPERLARQRDAWEVAERMLVLFHFLTRAEDPVYRAATDRIAATLTVRLGQ